MKLHLIPVLALTLFTVISVQADDHRFKEAFSQVGAFSSTGKITLENINGDVAIDTWDKNEILIEGVKSAQTEEELKRIELMIDRSESRTDIKVKLPKRNGGWSGKNSIRGGVRFKLMVPATATLERINTVNSSITINGVRGSVDAESVNGRIRAHDLGGSARLKSVNGGLTASFTTVAAEQKLSFDTVNGSVEAVLPDNSGFELQASVVNGHIDCDFPVQVQGGRIGGKNLSGKVGGGGASLSAESVNGSVRIKKS